jgi:hypothetical protein
MFHGSRNRKLALFLAFSPEATLRCLESWFNKESAVRPPRPVRTVLLRFLLFTATLQFTERSPCGATLIPTVERRNWQWDCSRRGGTNCFQDTSRPARESIAPNSSKSVYRCENRFRPGPHSDVIDQVHPPDRAGRVNEEFGGPCDVFTSLAAPRMQHSVLPNRLGLGI